MSHFTVAVFTKPEGRTVEELLAPYDESIVVAPYAKYTRESAIAKVRKEIEEYKNGLYAKYLKNPEEYEKNCSNEAHIDYLKNKFPKKMNWSDDECYEDMKIYFDEDMIDSNGDLLSTYNPNSKWDWYEVGGRWNGGLKNKSGNMTNEDYVSEIIWDESSIPFAFVATNGVWKERGQMGWWAIVTDEKEKDMWHEEFMNYVNSLDDDVTVTLVDCHI